MKKALIWMLVFAFVLALAGCGSSNNGTGGQTDANQGSGNSGSSGDSSNSGNSTDKDTATKPDTLYVALSADVQNLAPFLT